jgi:hypothetical protein
MTLTLPDLWQHLQRQLFPLLLDELGPLSEKDRQFIQVVSLLPLGGLLERYAWCGVGCPPHERTWLLHAFIAKAVYGLATTEALLEMLKVNGRLRRLCGWEGAGEIPHASTFSRAFAQFAADELPQPIHEQMIMIHCGGKLAGHVSRDATAIEVRERPTPKPKAEPAASLPPRKRGRPKRGEVRPPKPPSKLEAQLERSLTDNLAGLPRACTIGCKTNSKGHTDWWTGYKLHCDTIDGDIPVAALLTSASMNDMLAAIPLMALSAQRVRSLYDLMDAGYDAEPIRAFSRRLGHVPIIDQNSQRHHERPLDPAEQARYRERTASERINSRLKDEFGGRTIRVRGAQKVMAHLMYGVIALAALGIWARLC